MSRTVNKSRRLLEIAEMLRLKPRRATDLAKHFGVDRRTIQRDLLEIEEMHSLEQSGDVYSIARPPSALNDVEALAVHSATRLLVHTGVGERHYRSSLAKLAEQLPDPARSGLVRSMETLTPGSDDRTLDLVAQAWFQGKVLRAKYRSAKGTNWHTHEYEIYFFEVNRRNLEPYVIARERLYFDSIGTFKLTRMRDVLLLDEDYEIPEDFDPLDHLSGAWGVVVGTEVNVRIRAEPPVARWFIEHEPTDPNLTVGKFVDDGSLEVTVTGQLTTSGEAYELMSFLLGWGENIEVLEPEDIRSQVAERLKAAADKYG